jgi:hypothetical protein
LTPGVLPMLCSGRAPSSRYRHTATLVGTRLFIMGGADNGDDISDTSKEGDMDVYSLDVQVSEVTRRILTNGHTSESHAHSHSHIPVHTRWPYSLSRIPCWSRPVSHGPYQNSLL